MLPIGPTHGDRRVARHATAAKTETPGVLALRKCRGYCERVCTGAGKFEDSQVPTHIVGRDCWTGVGDGIPPQRYALCSTDRAVRREQERTPHHRAVPTLGLRQSEPCHQPGSDSCADAPTDRGSETADG